MKKVIQITSFIIVKNLIKIKGKLEALTLKSKNSGNNITANEGLSSFVGSIID